MKICLEEQGKEKYKLDVSIEYVLSTAQNVSKLRLPMSFYNGVGKSLEEEIKANKRQICKDTKINDFDISFNSFDAENNVMIFIVVFDEKVIGKYFTSCVTDLLQDWQKGIQYGNKTITFIVNEVNAMLRYVS